MSPFFPGKKGRCSGEVPQPGPSVAGKKIIKWGWDIPSPSLVRKNIRRMERTVYDGIAIRFYADIPNEQGKIEAREMDARWISYRPFKLAHVQRAMNDL